MTVRPEDFLAHAKDLLTKAGAREIDFRMAAGRAYYGVYHCIRLHLKLAVDPNAGSVHRQVKDALYSQPLSGTGATVVAAKRHFTTLLQLRKVADYDLDVAIDRATAHDAVKRAAEVISAK